MLGKEIITLIGKEITLEWRQKYALNGMLLYVVSTIFVAYLSFNLRGASLDPIIWNALLWIILLFTAVNAIAKSFTQESEARNLYYYTLVSPQGIVLSKMLYNSLLMLLLTFLGFGIYALVLDNPVADLGMYLLTLLLGALGFASTLTLVSAIASKTGNNATLMAVLGFPVILPMILMLVKLSKNALDGLDRSQSMDEILVLLAINGIVIALSYLLFPYVWRN